MTACLLTEPLPLPDRSTLQERIDLDRLILAGLTLQCQECRRYGPAKDGDWKIQHGIVYCVPCAEAEA